MSRRGRLVLAILLALAAGSMIARTRAVAARRDPVALLRNPALPQNVVSGLLQGSPAQSGWQEAAAPFAGPGRLRVLLLLALSREGELEPLTRSRLEGLVAQSGPEPTSKGASLDLWLATFALERPSEVRRSAGDPPLVR